MLMEENIYDIDWYSVYKSYKQLDIYWKWFFFEVINNEGRVQSAHHHGGSVWYNQKVVQYIIVLV